MILISCTYAQGEQRMVSRIPLPDIDPITLIAWTDADIVDYIRTHFGGSTDTPALSAGKLIAIQKSLDYDGTAIPNDVTNAHTNEAVLLLGASPGGAAKTTQFRIPFVNLSDAGRLAAIDALWSGLAPAYDENGVEFDAKIIVQEKRQRLAKGSA